MVTKVKDVTPVVGDFRASGEKPVVKRGKTPGSGRKKGTPNKKTASFREALESRGFILEDAILHLWQTAEDEEVRFRILELVTKYVQPKPLPRVEEGQQIAIAPAQQYTQNNMLLIVDGKKKDG